MPLRNFLISKRKAATTGSDSAKATLGFGDVTLRELDTSGTFTVLQQREPTRKKINKAFSSRILVDITQVMRILYCGALTCCIIIRKPINTRQNSVERRRTTSGLRRPTLPPPQPFASSQRKTQAMAPAGEYICKPAAKTTPSSKAMPVRSPDRNHKQQIAQQYSTGTRPDNESHTSDNNN